MGARPLNQTPNPADVLADCAKEAGIPLDERSFANARAYCEQQIDAALQEFWDKHKIPLIDIKWAVR